METNEFLENLKPVVEKEVWTKVEEKIREDTLVDERRERETVVENLAIKKTHMVLPNKNHLQPQ